jgi:hypothetical protein
LPKRYRQRSLQRVVKDRVAGLVVEVGHHDGVSIGQRLALVPPVVHCTTHPAPQSARRRQQPRRGTSVGGPHFPGVGKCAVRLLQRSHCPTRAARSPDPASAAASPPACPPHADSAGRGPSPAPYQLPLPPPAKPEDDKVVGGIVLLAIYTIVTTVLLILLKMASHASERLYFALSATSAALGLLRILLGDPALRAGLLRVCLLSAAVVVGVMILRALPPTGDRPGRRRLAHRPTSLRRQFRVRP